MDVHCPEVVACDSSVTWDLTDKPYHVFRELWLDATNGDHRNRQARLDTRGKCQVTTAAMHQWRLGEGRPGEGRTAKVDIGKVLAGDVPAGEVVSG